MCSILHVDADAFFASVAQRDDPSLRGRPVVVGAWVVMAASYEARRFGVHSGMPAARARAACPGLVCVQPDFEAYTAASRELFAVLRATGARVEPGSMEEAFLDVRGLPGEPAALARRLRTEVRRRVGLPLSVGVARTKALAKLASRAAKPDGLRVVPEADEVAFLHPLPVGAVWGIGPATAGRLQAAGLRTVGEVAACSQETLIALLGKASGRYVHAVAQRRDPRPVTARRGRRSIGAQRSLAGGRGASEDPQAALAMVVGRVVARMERAGRAGRTLSVRVRYGDWTTAARSRTFAQPTVSAPLLLAAGRELLAALTVPGRRLTLVGVSVSNLDGSAHQLTLL